MVEVEVAAPLESLHEGGTAATDAGFYGGQGEAEAGGGFALGEALELGEDEDLAMMRL